MNKKILIAIVLIVIVAAAILMIFSYSPSSEENEIKEIVRQHLEELEGSDTNIVTKNIRISPDGTQATVESSVTWPDAPGTGIRYELAMKKINGDWAVESEKVLSVS